MSDPTLSTTRRALHGVAELLLAGPQYAACAEISLRVTPGGFGTTHTPDVRVVGAELVAGGRRTALDARTPRQLGEAVGIEPATLDQVYRDGSGVALDDVLSVAPDAAARLEAAYSLGDAALRAFAPDETPILWPEHFDIGVTIEAERVNYGISPGDAHIGVPYMYAGPWTPPPVDEFWTHPFGAARELPPTLDEVVDFFEQARARL